MRKILILTLFIILCSTLAVAGELTEHTVNVEGKQRNFYVYLPDNYNPEYQYPLLFMFHGLGGNYNDVSSESYGIKELADQNQFIAVFPDSLSNIPPKDITWNNFVLFPGYDTFALPGSSQTKRWDISHVQSSDRYNSQDVKFVDAIKDYLGPSVLDTHVFSTGHSYGAIFSYYLAMSRPELITSFGSHSGGLLKFLEDQELIDSVKNNLPIQQKFWFNFYINYLNGLPEEQVEWTIFPIPVRKGVQVPGILISSTKDSVVPYKWSQVLQADLTKHNHPNQLITLNNAELYGHGWDKSKNQVQWDFFIEHAPAIVEFVTTENSGVESDSPKQISLRLNSAREQSVVIALQKSGTANAEDFTVPLTVTFLPGEVEKTINLEIISDDLIEEDETIILTLSSEQAIIGNKNQYTYTIVDDTEVPSLPSEVEFTFSEGSDLESESPVGISITLTPAREEQVVIALQKSGTANAEDFTVPSKVTFAPGETIRNFQLNIFDDEEVEEDETIILTLEVQEGDVETNQNNKYHHTILNDDELPQLTGWTPKLLTSLDNNIALIWKNNQEPNWFVQFDYLDNSQPMIEVDFGPYANYEVQKVQVSPLGKRYWWALWASENNYQGLYRQDKNGNRIKVKKWRPNTRREIKDFAVLGENPYVAFQYNYRDRLFVLKLNHNGKKITRKRINSPNYKEDWEMKFIASDNSNSLKVLWEEKEGNFQVWNLNPTTLKKESSTSFNLEGFTALDLEILEEQALILLSEEESTSIHNGEEILDLEIPNGWEATGLEVTSDNKVHLLLSNEFGQARVWQLNQETGALESFKEYSP